MKKLIVLLILVSAVILNAAKTDFIVNGKNITLNFENIKIKDIEYVSGTDITVIHGRKDEVEISQTDSLLYVTAPQLVKAKIKLPASKMYRHNIGTGKFIFNERSATIYSDSGETVKFTEDGLFIKDHDQEVHIGKNGILVDGRDEYVEINAKGIVVEGSDAEENETITNIWGQMLGGFIGFMAKASLSFLGDDSSRIAKLVINEENFGDSNSIVNINVTDDGSNNIAKKNIAETYSVKKGTTLTVENINGGITVLPAQDENLKIEAFYSTRKGYDAFENVEMKVSDSKQFTIQTIHKVKNCRVSTSYKIYVPDQVKLENLHTSNGAIDIEGTKGDVTLKSSNGKITVNMHNGAVWAKTSNGAIEAVGVTGETTLKTSNGKIRVEDCPALISTRTSNAAVSVEMAELNRDLEIDTSNGSVALYLPANSSAAVSGETSNGSIKTYDLVFDDFEKYNNSLQGRLGKGKHEVTISTSNASIKIYETETWR